MRGSVELRAAGTRGSGSARYLSTSMRRDFRATRYRSRCPTDTSSITSRPLSIQVRRPRREQSTLPIGMVSTSRCRTSPMAPPPAPGTSLTKGSARAGGHTYDESAYFVPLPPYRRPRVFFHDYAYRQPGANA